MLPGHLPGFELVHEFYPQPGDLMWTPADWAWAGGLLNAMLPSLHHGVPVVARKFEKFDPEEAFRLLQDHGIRNTFVPPTALRMLRAVDNPRGRFDLKLRTIASAGEALGAETLAWGREALGLTINEAYGQTECNLVLGSCGALGMVRPGAIGKATPGHDVAVIRPDGTRCEPGELGQIAVRRPDPVMFLGYWNRPEATAEKFIGDWMTTGDQGEADADGFVRFVGRDDERHHLGGIPHRSGRDRGLPAAPPRRGERRGRGQAGSAAHRDRQGVHRAEAGCEGSDGLAGEIQRFVRERLSAHEYPREIAFIRDLPLTTTGKVIRRQLRALA